MRVGLAPSLHHLKIGDTYQERKDIGSGWELRLYKVVAELPFDADDTFYKRYEMELVSTRNVEYGDPAANTKPPGLSNALGQHIANLLNGD